MAIKQGATCIDMAIHTTLLTLRRLERDIFLPFPPLFGVMLSNINAQRDQNQRIS